MDTQDTLTNRQRESFDVIAESGDLYGGDLQLDADGLTLCCGCEDTDFSWRTMAVTCAACGAEVEIG